MSALPFDTQRAAATLIAFVGTFFIALTVGRFLKRRAEVRLGLLYQLFCLALAFYVALAVFGVQAPWRVHFGAAAVLLSTALVVALVNRYVWDLYFERRKQTPIPHFLREIVALVIFVVALLFVLSFGYHAERELKGVVATSGAAALILGLAGQNLLGGIIAGMSLQINRPYRVGDWLQVGDRFAEVMEINWRSTRLRTNDAIYLDIPNNEIVKSTIVNLHYPTEVHAMRIRVGVDYNVPPNRVKDALARAAQSAKNVLPSPPVKVSSLTSAITPSRTRSNTTWAITPGSMRPTTRCARMFGTNSNGSGSIFHIPFGHCSWNGGLSQHERATRKPALFCAANRFSNVCPTARSTIWSSGRSSIISGV